jgi:hypothetical protein
MHTGPCDEIDVLLSRDRHRARMAGFVCFTRDMQKSADVPVPATPREE